MSFLRLLVMCLLVVCPALLRADWSGASFGSPVIEVFRPQQTGVANRVRTVVQDPKTGRLYFSAVTGLYYYDGVSWKSLGKGPDAPLMRLSMDPAQDRLWAGCSGDLGYYELGQQSEVHFVSLKEKLPFPASELRIVWGCFATQDGADFVTDNRVLRWNGSRFQVWEFPNKTRLCPIQFEGSCWFQHFATGLYRMGASGPVKIADPHQLPRLGEIFMLEKREDRLVGASNAGLTTIEDAPKSLSEPELNKFTNSGLLIGCAAIQSGYVLSTLHNGAAIVSRNGALTQVLDKKVGVVGRLAGQFVDRDGDIWILAEQNIVRIPSAGASSRVVFPNVPADLGVASIAVENDSSLWVATGQGVFHVEPGAGVGNRLKVTETALNATAYSSALMTKRGLMGFSFRTVELVEQNSSRTTIANDVSDVSGALALRSRADSFILFARNGLNELVAQDSDKWRTFQHEGVPKTNYYMTNAVEDAAGNLWASSYIGPPYFLKRDGERYALVAVPQLAAFSKVNTSAVFSRPHDILLVAGNHLLLADADGTVRDLHHSLPQGAVPAAISRDGSRLYLHLHRPDAPKKFTFGIGQLEITRDGSIGPLREFIVPGLASIGALSSLAVTSEAGTDTLWIGGSEGLLQARVAELKEWQPPHPPAITLLSSGRPAASTEFAFQHQLDFQLRAHEVSLRPAIRFQARLGGDDAPWSDVTERTSFEFSSLREGTYVFAARTINPLGQTSEPVAFTFSILPPWYRSPWAYAGYLALCGLGIYGTMRYREGRIRARAAQLEKLVDERTAELVKANAAKDEFLASMSHEIRNPMNGVVGLSAAIDIAPLDDEGRHRFALLRHCASHLASLLEDILDFSKLQAGAIELDPAPFAVADLLDAVAAITTPAASEAKTPLEFAVGPTVPPRLVGDARRLRQVLLNYVTNALKYAPEGQIDVTVWARATTAGHARVTFAVTDQGPGIPASEHERVFEKFERGSRARTQRIAGTGMGLAVCRKLATAMGGRAWVESTPDEGATFFLEVELPVAPALAAPVSNQPESSGRLSTALVVDDEEYNVIALTTLLQHHGFTVTGFVRASDALTRAETQRYDAVFLDYDMPEITGPQLARRLREIYTPLGHQPLIFATTAYTTVEKRAECLAAGMNDFLGKPVSASRLARLLAAHGGPGLQPVNSASAAAPGPDPLQNLRRLAAQRQRNLESELTEFVAETVRELGIFDDAVRRQDTQACARYAHRLIGRFGFVFAGPATDGARRLEAACHASDWSAVAQLRADIELHWADTQRTLVALTSGPAA